MKRERVHCQPSPDQFLKKAGFTIHHFNKNNIHTISHLTGQHPDQSCHYDPDKEETEENREDSAALGVSDPHSIKAKVQSFIKRTILVQKKKQQAKSMVFSKELFKEKIQKFINTFKEKSQKMVDEKEGPSSEIGKDKNLGASDLKGAQTKIAEKKNEITSNGIFARKKRKKKIRELKQFKEKSKRKRRREEEAEEIDRQCKSAKKQKKQRFKQKLNVFPEDSSRITRSVLHNSTDKTIELTSCSQNNEIKTIKKRVISKTTVKINKDKQKIRVKDQPDEETEFSESVTIKKLQKEVTVDGYYKKIEVQQSEKIVKKKQKSKDNEEYGNFALLRYQQMLISNLPSRNPQITHIHNSVPSQNISLRGDLVNNTLYFASEILRFKRLSLGVSCTNFHMSFIEETLRSSKNCKAIPQQPESQLKKIKLKRNFQYQNKKTLVLDLDETLVHSQGLNQVPNKTIFPFSFEFDKTTRHYSIRNYTEQFLKNVAEKYYIVVFTSALQGYADNIIEQIDPQEKYVQHRLYRGNCYLYNDSCPYIKDLRILNRDLSQVIIVDNSLYAYWFNVDNGVPIAPFTGAQDNELVKLQQYLLKLQNVDDVRTVNRRAFHMHLFQEVNNTSDLMLEYCSLMKQEIGEFEKKQKVKKKQKGIEEQTRTVIDLQF